MIDWDKFTGNKIERTAEEQKAVDFYLEVWKDSVNQGSIELFNPESYYIADFIPGSTDKMQMIRLVLPKDIISQIEDYRMLFGYDILTKEQLMKFLVDVHVPYCFKTFHVNNRELNKGILI